MVVLRLGLHRRAASVPLGEPGVTDDTNLATRHGLLFSRAVIDTTDALSSASKRNDQQFLRDISAKIGNAPFTQPYVKPIRKARVYGAGSPLTTRRRSIAVSSVLRHPAVDIDTTEADVDYEVKLIAPITNRITKYGRATSVPPILPIGSRHAVQLSGDEAEFYHAPSIYDLEIQNQPSVTTSYAQKLNPVADLAVRQAHRNLDRIERELKSSGDVIIARPTSPRTVIYTAYRDGPWRRSSYYGPRSATVRARSQSPVRKAPVAPVRKYVRSTLASVPVLSDDELIDYHVLPPTKLERDLKTDLILAGVEPDHHTTHVYRARTDLPLSSVLPPSTKHSIHWSPVPSSPLHDLHLHSAGHLLLPSTTSIALKKLSTGATPHLNYSVTPLHTFTTPLTLATFTHAPQKPPIVPKKVAPAPPPLPPPPPPPAPEYIPSGLPTVIRPRVSETRRKVRDVLCKVKGDPHYFDY